MIMVQNANSKLSPFQKFSTQSQFLEQKLGSSEVGVQGDCFRGCVKAVSPRQRKAGEEKQSLCSRSIDSIW